MKVVIIGTVASSILGFRLPYIKKLLKENNTVYAFAMDYTDEQKKQLNAIGVIPIDYSLSRSGLNPLSEYKSTVELYKKIKQIKPDVVFSYFTKPVVYGSLAAKLAKIPRIVGMVEGLGTTFTESPDGFTGKQKVIKFIQSKLYQVSSYCLDNLIVLNEDDKKDLECIAKFKKISVLGGIGLDLNEYPYSPIVIHNNINFIFVSRLLKNKGIEYLFQAAEIIKNKYSNVIFTILGEPDKDNTDSISLEYLQYYVNSNMIDYHGSVDNVNDYLQQSSVFILPSYYREGVPRCTQEALSVGRPVITTDSTGCRDTVIDGYNGYLVPKWDVQSLVDKMEIFINDPQKIVEMGKNSRQLAEQNFDVNKVNNKLFGLVFDEKII